MTAQYKHRQHPSAAWVAQERPRSMSGPPSILRPFGRYELSRLVRRLPPTRAVATMSSGRRSTSSIPVSAAELVKEETHLVVSLCSQLLDSFRTRLTVDKVASRSSTVGLRFRWITRVQPMKRSGYLPAVRSTSRITTMGRMVGSNRYVCLPPPDEMRWAAFELISARRVIGVYLQG